MRTTRPSRKTRRTTYSVCFRGCVGPCWVGKLYRPPKDGPPSHRGGAEEENGLGTFIAIAIHTRYTRLQEVHNDLYDLSLRCPAQVHEYVISEKLNDVTEHVYIAVSY